MAFTSLDPAPTVPLSTDWELAASEASRTGKGLQASVHLLNGESQGYRTIVLLIERYKRMRKEAGRKDATVNRELAFLTNLFTMAMKWGKASENPVKQVRLFREDNGRTHFVTEEEETRLLTACSPTLRPVVIAALHTGLRKSELLSLTWQEVDFQRRMITVQASYAKNGETRSVPMNATLTTTLRALPSAAVPTDAVFLTYRGVP